MAPYLNLAGSTNTFGQLSWTQTQSVYWCPSQSVKDRTVYMLDGSPWYYTCGSYGYNVALMPDLGAFEARKIGEYVGKESVSVLFYEYRIKQPSEGGVFVWYPGSIIPHWSYWQYFIIDKPAHLNKRNYFTFILRKA